MQPHSFNDLIALYKVYRDYMKHEDDLLNQRTTWLLVIQGFLFATLAVLGEWGFPPVATPDRLQTERQFLVYVLVVVGITIAVVAFIGIKAASDAIDTLYKKWNEIRTSYERWESVPDIAGGGHENAHKLGKKPPRFIPVVIGVAWLAVLFMALIDQVSPPKSTGSTASVNQVSTSAPLTQQELLLQITHSLENVDDFKLQERIGTKVVLLSVQSQSDAVLPKSHAQHRRDSD